MTVTGTPAIRWLDDGTAQPGRRRAEIPQDSPLFTGHFPGHPIFPGIAHLALVEGAVGPLREVRTLKLRLPVLPGDVLDLFTAPPGENGWIRFELRREREPVSTGAVRAGPLEGRPPALDSQVTRAGESSLPAVVEALLPHGPPSRLVEGITEALPDRIVCKAKIPPDHPLVVGEQVSSFVGIEMAAQAAAALEALNRQQVSTGPRLGYLVGVREARFVVASLPTGRALSVTAQFQGGAFPLSLYEITVGLPGSELVTGSISTYLADGASTRGG